MKDREVGCRNLRAGKEEYPQNEEFEVMGLCNLRRRTEKISQNERFGWVSLQIEELRALRDFRMRNPQIEELRGRILQYAELNGAKFAN